MTTATATVAAYSSAENCINRLHYDALPLIDTRVLSQSELLSLSFCSSSSFLHNLRNDTDVSTLKIDRSVFNESAGSRKQTFSRMKLAPPRNSSQFSSPVPVQASFSRQSFDQPLDGENARIVAALKSFFSSDSASGENIVAEGDNLVTVPIQEASGYLWQPFPNAVADCGSRKRKRGRPRKNEYFNQLITSEIKPIVVHGNVQQEKENKEIEVVVDLGDLGSAEEPFDEELGRRTAGMQTEAELLGFLQGLEGEWVSSRKKRRIVDASALAEVLPREWKLMLSIRRKAGHLWLGCIRYIRFLAIVS